MDRSGADFRRCVNMFRERWNLCLWRLVPFGDESSFTVWEI